jgi:N-acetylglucosamine-6-phosphate deacetylase
VSLLIHSARVVQPGAAHGERVRAASAFRNADDTTVVEGGWIHVVNGHVAASGTGESWRAVADHRSEIVDATAVAGAGAVLTPGFIDLHGHGGGGHAYDDGADAIRAARATHRAHGTTRAVISLVTAPVAELADRVRVVAELVRTDADVLGSHLEGPFLDRAHKGAHDENLLRPPHPAEIEALLAAGAGTVRQITLAPELPGGLDAVRRAVAAGAAVAVGHTGADAEATAAAFDAGATILTHAFNAMPGLHHRLPGPVGAALADGRVTLEAIADGVHLHPEIVRMLFAAAPGRIALVTDAMAAAGAEEGAYRLGGLDVTVADGAVHLAGTDTIAGSTLTQDRALRIAVAAGVPLTAAVHALTAAPARAIGRGDLAHLSRGALGDLVLLSADLEVAAVWTAGVRA